MSDDHTGLSHDLPEYVPNWPVPARKAWVYKATDGFWYWGHACPKGGWAYGPVSFGALEPAFEAALKHVRGCW